MPRLVDQGLGYIPVRDAESALPGLFGQVRRSMRGHARMPDQETEQDRKADMSSRLDHATQDRSFPGLYDLA